MTSQTEHYIILLPLPIIKDPGPALTRNWELKWRTDQCGWGNKVCSARPISSQPVGRPSVQWGLPDEQRWTTVHSVTPFPSSDPRPQPCRPSGIFQVMHSSNSEPFLQVSTYRHSRPAQLDSTDVLICPSASRWLSDWKIAGSLKSRHF